MSTQNKIYYFLIGNYNAKKEIGSYKNPDVVISNVLITKCSEIFNDNNINKSNSKFNINSQIFQNYKIFYAIHPSNTFYLLVTDEKNRIRNKTALEIFEDIENQGIKILIGQDGKLSSIGKKNLKFCIEQKSKTLNIKLNEEENENEEEEENENEKEKINENEKEENNEKEEIKEKDSNSLLNKTTIDIKNQIKKNSFRKINDMHFLKNRNVEINDNSYKYGNDYNDRKIRIYKWMKITYVFAGIFIGLTIVYFVFFK